MLRSWCLFLATKALTKAVVKNENMKMEWEERKWHCVELCCAGRVSSRPLLPIPRRMSETSVHFLLQNGLASTMTHEDKSRAY